MTSRLLYHRWAAGPRLGSSAKTWICAAPAAYLCSRCDQRQLDAIIACQCALARLVYTQSGLVSLSDIPICRSSNVTSPFPPSGNEGYIRNRDVMLLLCSFILAYTVGLYQMLPDHSLWLSASQAQTRWQWRWSDHKVFPSHRAQVQVESQVFFNYVESSRKLSNFGLESESSLESCDSSPHPWYIYIQLFKSLGQ